MRLSTSLKALAVVALFGVTFAASAAPAKHHHHRHHHHHHHVVNR